MFFEPPPKKKYGAKVNVIKIADNKYAVRKYLLPPKYYDSGLANLPERQKRVKKLDYVIFEAKEIIEDIKDFMRPHILDDYEYPFDNCTYPDYQPNRAPYPQQIYVARWLLGYTGTGDPINNGRGHNLFNSMRTGKSVSCLWAAVFGLERGIFKKIIIVAPKTVMKSTWAKELSAHFMHVQYTIKQGVARDRISDTPIDIIGWDGLTSLFKRNMVDKYTLIIYDEATAIKSVSTTRWKLLSRWFNNAAPNLGCRIWMLTGTPLAQSPMDAYGLARIVSPHLVPKNITAWRDLTQYKVWGYEYKNKDKCAEICAQALQPSLRFELKDIDDIADHTFVYTDVEKSVKQAKMFKQLAEEFLITYGRAEADPLTAANAADKASKLLQVLSGCIYDQERNVIDTDATNRLEVLCDIIDQLPETQGVVIFAEWTHTIRMLHKYLEPKYKTVEIIDGSTGNGDRDIDRLAIERRFQEGKTKIVIAHPVTCSLGLDFSSSNVLIWYTPTYRGALFQQGNDRIRNFASKSRGFVKFFVYLLVADPLERVLYESLENKLLTQIELFNLIRTTLKNEFVV